MPGLCRYSMKVADYLIYLNWQSLHLHNDISLFVVHYNNVNLFNIVAKDFKALNGACKCLQELGILYPRNFKIFTPNTPQMMPIIPPKTSYLGPSERIFKVWELWYRFAL